MPRCRDAYLTGFLTAGIAILLLTRSWFSNPIAWDGFGYFLYLPLLFIHNDLGMTDPAIVQGMFATYAPSDTFYQAHLAPTGYWVIRYTPGLALLHMPGFLVAHALAAPLGYAADGLSLPYQVAVLITSLCCLWVGLFALLRFLRTLVTGLTPMVVVTLLLYGTNLFDQAIEHPLMTHLYTFALMAALLWSTHRLHAAPDARKALLAGTIMGLLVLVRPTNAIALLIPLTWPLQQHGPLSKWGPIISAHRGALICFVTATAIPVLLLLLYWRLYAGTWLYNSYQNPGEGIDLLHPHLYSFLFSYRKGWLLYTPIVAIGLIGLAVSIPHAQRRLRWPIWAYLGTFLYVVSTWTVWYYPGGFGQRAAVDVLPVVGIGMAVVFQWAGSARPWIRASMVGTAVLLVAFMHFQLWQQRQHFRPPDRMTKAYYWATFLHTRPDTDLEHLLGPDRIHVPSAPDTTHYRLAHTWKVPWSKDREPFTLSADVPFTPAWERPFRELTETDHAWVQVSGELHRSDTTTDRAALVMLMEHDGSYGYREFPLRSTGKMTDDGWEQFTYWYLTPIARNEGDELRIYGWHQAGVAIALGELEIRSWIPRDRSAAP